MIKLEPRQCAYCLNPFAPAYEREVCCSESCKTYRKKRQIADYRRKHKKQLPMANCIECGAAFQPRSKTQITCGNDCRAERGRARARAQQSEMRALRDNVNTAHTMLQDAVGPMLMAETVAELDYAYTSSLATQTAALKKLKATIQSKILKGNSAAAYYAVAQSLDNLLCAAAQLDAEKSQGVRA